MKGSIMKFFKRVTFFLFLFLSIFNFLYCNVWIDENFDDGLDFNASDIDTFDAGPPTSPALSFTNEDGSVTTEKAFNGSYSYKLTAGQTLSVGATNYENPKNGPFQYIQFAVSVDSIPASPGSMAKLIWNWNINSTDYSFYIDFQSTGSAINIVAGESLVFVTSQTIDTITNANDWKYITLQFQKNAISATDNRTGQTLSQGMRFYVDNSIPKLEILLPGTGVIDDTGKDWSINVTTGSLYLDDFYWEGGMTNGYEADGNLRPFDNGKSSNESKVEVLSAIIDPVYDTLFQPNKNGWLGGDCASSVPLSPTKILWLFGDTFVGLPSATNRVGSHFINNSIAIQDLSSGPPGTVEFYWGMSGGNPRAFFYPQVPSPDFFYWPGIGAFVDGQIYVFLFKVQITGGGSFGFSVVDTTLIRIPNPTDPPDQWQQIITDLQLGGDHQGFNTAVWVNESYFYFLGYDDPNDNLSYRRMVLARVLIEDMKNGQDGSAFEFYVDGVSGSEWSDAPVNLHKLYTPGVTESGIQYIPDWGQYLATSYYVFSPNMYIHTAPALTGPWSNSVKIYEVPEMALDPYYFAYAGKLHPELSTTTGELIMTYAVNTSEPDAIWTDMSIYYPRFVRIQLAWTSAIEEELWQLF